VAKSDKRKNTNTVEIKRSHLILCEGKDDENFLIQLLCFLIEKDKIFDEFQVLTTDGDSKLKDKLDNLKNIFKVIKISTDVTVKTISIIFDADDNAAGRIDSIKTVIKNAGFEPPGKPFRPSGGTPKTGFVLFPKCDENPQNGRLEDLCMRIVKENDKNNVMKLNILKDKISLNDNEINWNNFTHAHKNKLHTYFSLSNEYVGLKLGEAAKARAFNFESDELKPLIDFLAMMYNSAK
jgi:hypothetical protein